MAPPVHTCRRADSDQRCRRKPRIRWRPLLGHPTGDASRSYRTVSRCCAIAFYCGLSMLAYGLWAEPGQRHAYGRSSSSPSTRHLLSTVEWERCDPELASGVSKYIWVVLYGIFILITFVALAIVCDDFFVPSLEAISEKLELSEDVAGATFMAAGSSAPELFTSVAGVAVESDIGVGTIVGSAVFNILIIVALSAALAGQVLKLDWRPMARDAIFYGLSIGAFITFAWDTEFTWYEAVVLLVMYALYIVLMKFNSTLMNTLEKCPCASTKPAVTPEDGGASPAALQPNAQLQEKPPANTSAAAAAIVPPAGTNGDVNRPMPERRSSRALQRRLSNLSIKSTPSEEAEHKHIFHHVKHGELSQHFESPGQRRRSSTIIRQHCDGLVNLSQEELDRLKSQNWSAYYKVTSR